MFPLLPCAYPIFETIFTMYRRKFIRGVATGPPDGIHLHTLIHRRLIRMNFGRFHGRRQTMRNSMTSPYLWVLCLLSIIPSVLWWDSTRVLTGSCFCSSGHTCGCTGASFASGRRAGSPRGAAPSEPLSGR